MIQFNETVNELMLLLLEGGNAIKSSSRINQENVEGTLISIYKKFLPALKLKQEDSASLGSTGKKNEGGSSGDIDLAISMDAIFANNPKLDTLNDMLDFLEAKSKTVSADVYKNYGITLVSLAWPIVSNPDFPDRNQDGEFVQLDLMPTASLSMSKWNYYSPAEWESEWKGLYRNEILYAIAKFLDYKSLEKAFDAEGVEIDVKWERHFFDLAKGILKGTQFKPKKKRGEGYVKSVKTVSKDLISNNPTEIVKLLFGPNYKPNDILTFDETLDAVLKKDFIHKKYIKKILKMTAGGIKGKGYPIPEALEKHL